MKRFIEICACVVGAAGISTIIAVLAGRKSKSEVSKMEKSKIIAANEKIAESVTKGYKKIENGVVGGYKKIESGVVGGFEKISDAFVEEFLMRGDETLEEAKKRLAEEQAARERKSG